MGNGNGILAQNCDLLIVIFCIIFLTGCSSASDPLTSTDAPTATGAPGTTDTNAAHKPSAASDESAEYKLASLDAGYPLPPSHASVTRFRRILRTIEDKTGFTAGDIGGKLVVAQQMLKENGINETLYYIAGQVSDTIGDGPRGCPLTKPSLFM